MGESLVGAYEGQSFSFVYNKEKKNFGIKTYPNKCLALKNKGFIFRSDSNTEDLEGFAGAGLFDSIPMVEYEEIKMEYGINKIFWEESYESEKVIGIRYCCSYEHVSSGRLLIRRRIRKRGCRCRNHTSISFRLTVNAAS